MSDLLNGIMNDEEESCNNEPTPEEDRERAVKCALMGDEEAGFEEPVVFDAVIVEDASDDEQVVTAREQQQRDAQYRIRTDESVETSACESCYAEEWTDRRQNGEEPAGDRHDEEGASDLPRVVDVLEEEVASASPGDTESLDAMSQSVQYAQAQLVMESRISVENMALIEQRLRKLAEDIDKKLAEKLDEFRYHCDNMSVSQSTAPTEPLSMSGSVGPASDNEYINRPASWHTPSSTPHRAQSMDPPSCSPDSATLSGIDPPSCASISEEEEDMAAEQVRPQPAVQPRPDRPDPPEEDVFYDYHGRPRKFAYDSETHSYSHDERPYQRRSHPSIQRRATRGDFQTPQDSQDSQTQQATCGNSHAHYVHESDDSTCAAQSLNENLLTPARARHSEPWRSFHSEQTYSREFDSGNANRTFPARPTSPSQVSGARSQDRSNEEQESNRPTKRKARPEDYLQRGDDDEDRKPAAKPTPTPRDSDAHDQDLKARDSNKDDLARKPSPRPKSPSCALRDEDEDDIKKDEQKAKSDAKQSRSQGFDTDDVDDEGDDERDSKKMVIAMRSDEDEGSSTSVNSDAGRPETGEFSDPALAGYRPPQPGAERVAGNRYSYSTTSNYDEDDETVQVGSDTVNSADLIEAEVVNSEGANSAILNRMNELEDAVRQNQPPVIQGEIQRAEPVNNAPLVVKVSCCVIA